ncbi:MAG TPA: thioredoxin domain-containing protein [Edaphocola sp.]|nr:thioredoxin domain-containing protein [Edaphocola sp.]
MNRLKFEHSPYLLQHAANPVDWYPWGEEAFLKSKEEDKPILVSIGYAACHWCHVMEHESFEDIEIAKYMNEHFVNIKVDREERPDVDQIYMDAVQLLTGQGGWPLNVFLTPSKKPFYGGTYYPVVSNYGRPSWRQILESIHTSWIQRKNEILEQTDLILQHLQQINEQENGAQELPFRKNDFDKIVERLLKEADTINGGFGGAPKFPQTISLQFLLEYYYVTQEPKALQHVILTLNKMIAGGIYDQLDGGLARYSTDREWHVPHFEKMLYDNALFLEVLADAYMLTNQQEYKQVIEQTIDFCIQSLSIQESGIGFYSSLDADSEGVEGKYYVWSEAQISQHLPAKYATKIKEYWDISVEGNWEGVNILNHSSIDEEWIHDTLKELPDFYDQLNKVKESLLLERAQRVKPRLDNKVLLAWNALMVIALIKASIALNRPEWMQLAKKNIDFLLKQFTDGKQWYRCYIGGTAKINATLEDISYLIKALFMIGEQSLDYKYIMKAKELLIMVNEHFGDDQNRFYYFSSIDQEDILVRKIDTYDGVIPSVNAVMAENNLLYSKWFEDNDNQERCNKMLNAMVSKALHYPSSFSYWCRLLLRNVKQRTLFIVNDLETANKYLNQYLPFVIIANQEGGGNNSIPLTNKDNDGGTTYYLCNQTVCESPTNDLKKIIFKIKIEKMLE